MLDQKIPITAIILTYNEEKNIKNCIDSIIGLAKHIFVLDSYSTDTTLEIVALYPDIQIVQRPFSNYSDQRNWAFDNLPINSEWILNLDADHRVTDEIENELRTFFKETIPDSINGFMCSRRTIFLGKWIKYGGHYPTYHSILFRRGFGRCEEKLYDQHYKINGGIQKLKGDIIDIVSDSIQSFTTRHNKWSDLEALEQYKKTIMSKLDFIEPTINGNSIQRRRFMKNIYNRFPLFVRPILYFIFRYFFRLGFLDGRRGLIFHFLQCLWFRLLIDAKIYELRNNG